MENLMYEMSVEVVIATGRRILPCIYQLLYMRVSQPLMPTVAAVAALAWFGRTVEIDKGVLGLLDTFYDDPVTASHFGGSIEKPTKPFTRPRPRQPMFPPVVMVSDWNDTLGGFVVGYKHNVTFRAEIMTGTFYILFRPRNFYVEDWRGAAAYTAPVVLYTLPRVSDSSDFVKWTSSMIDPHALERALYLQARPDPFADSRRPAGKIRPVTIQQVLMGTPYGERSAALDNFNTPALPWRGIVNAASWLD